MNLPVHWSFGNKFHFVTVHTKEWINEMFFLHVKWIWRWRRTSHGQGKNLAPTTRFSTETITWKRLREKCDAAKASLLWAHVNVYSAVNGKIIVDSPLIVVNSCLHWFAISNNAQWSAIVCHRSTQQSKHQGQSSPFSWKLTGGWMVGCSTHWR